MIQVGIIGLGQISAGYGKPGTPAPYCHLGGLEQTDKANLAAVADAAEPAREAYRKKWGDTFPEARVYETTEAMLEKENLDVVAICVRGPHHFPVTTRVLEAGVRSIFLEKPPTCSLQEQDQLTALAGEKGVPLTVSYSRHWAPHVLRMQELIAEGLIGEVQKVVAYAGQRVLSFASHATDLICQFAGYNPTAVYARSRGMAEDQHRPDGYEAEPMLDNMLIEFPDGRSGVQLGHRGEHGPFYAEVLGTEGRARVGMYIPPHALDADRKEIDLSERAMPADASAFKAAYDQIADHLAGGPKPHCTDEHFTAINEVGFAAIESIARDQRITLPNMHRDRRIFANG